MNFPVTQVTKVYSLTHKVFYQFLLRAKYKIVQIGSSLFQAAMPFSKGKLKKNR